MVREEITPQKSSYGVDDYGYINARIRAMRTTLLGKAQLEHLLQAENLEALSSSLSSTDYGPDIKASEQKFATGIRRLDVMKDGLEQNFIRTMAKICPFLDGKPAELVNIILSRWDVLNLKVIIRGKHAELSPAQIIQHLFFVGTLKRDFLEQLAHTKDVKQVIDTLAKYYPPIVLFLKKQFDEYLTTGNLVDLELALEKWYYQHVLQQCDHLGEGFKLVRQFLQAEIDIVNAMTCLRLAQVDIEPNEAGQFYIPGGTKIDQRDFTNLIAMGGIEDMLSWLERIPTVRNGLRERIELYRRYNDINIFERLFEANLIKDAQSLARGDPLGFNILMSYLKLKYNELINLRIILRAVEFGLPKDMIWQELIFV